MKNTRLTFPTDELLADISTRCLLAANAAKGLGKEDAGDTVDVLDDGNREVVVSLVSRLMYECVNLLYPFAKRPMVNGSHVDRGDEVDAYAMELEFPHERSETEVQHVRRCVHDYVVYKCLAEWLALTLPDTGQWQAWELKAQDVREELATALVPPLRPRSLRIRPHFYWLMRNMAVHLMGKLSSILSTVWGWVIGASVSVVNFFTGYETSVTLTLLAVVLDGAWGIAAAVKQGRFTLSELARNTVMKISVYGTAIVVFIMIDKLLRIGDGLTLSVICAVIVLVEFWSMSASALICFPRMPFLRLLRKALVGEIAGKLGVKPEDVERTLEKM